MTVSPVSSALEELNRVHPLPVGDDIRIWYPWRWRIDADGPVACEVGPAEPDEVWIGANGTLESASGNPPGAVALAVLLAHTGILAELDRQISDARAEALRHGQQGRTELQASYHGIADGFSAAATMLRRGRVQP